MAPDMRIILFVAFLVILTLTSVHALSCLQCRQSHFLGEPGLDSCYHANDYSLRNTSNCMVTDKDSYCYTKIELSDGVISHLERGCTNVRHDPIQSNKYPDSIKCRTTYSTSVVSKVTQQSECYLSCARDNCNDMPITDNVKSCPRSCPTFSECNHITGQCQCAQNRSGADCDNAEQASHVGRSCVQCNSHTNPGCDNKTAGSRCMNGEAHCSTTQTWILNADGTLAENSSVTRACTGQYMSPDRCYLTQTNNIAVAEYTEYTCVSTCSSDNCNVGEANGVIDGEEFIPIKCVVCEGNELSCGPNWTKTTDCPVNTTHCMSTVTYWESNINDSNQQGRLRPEPSISIRSIKRECASSPIASVCTTKQVGSLSLKEVTCEETCAGDGCNTGWPCRPDCVQCEKANHESAGDDCIHFPSIQPRFCPGPHHAFCYFYLQNRTRYHNGQVLKREKFSAKRGCSTGVELNSPNKCKNITEYGKVTGVECVKYCELDGCNFEEGDLHFPADESKNQASKVGIQVQALFFFGLLLSSLWQRILA